MLLFSARARKKSASCPSHLAGQACMPQCLHLEIYRSSQWCRLSGVVPCFDDILGTFFYLQPHDGQSTLIVGDTAGERKFWERCLFKVS